MKTFAKIQLFSFLVFGLLFLIYALFLFVNGRGSEGVINALILAGIGQIVIFNVILFYTYREKIKEKFKK